MSETSSAQPAPPQPVAPPETVFWGLTKADFVKGIGFSLIVGLIGIGVGYWLNSKAPHLTIAIAAPVQFQGDKNKFGILTFSVTNDGSKEAEDVRCDFKTQGAKNPDIKATPDNLSPALTVKDDNVTIKVASMNPGERLDVVAYVPDVIPEKPDVKVRGKNVVGEEMQKGGWSAIGSLLIYAVFIPFSLVFLVIQIAELVALKWKNRARP